MSFFSFAWNWLKQPAQWHGSGGIPVRILEQLGYTALALTDVKVLREWEGSPVGCDALSFDGTLERYARRDAQGNVSVRRVADDSEIVRIPGPGSPTNVVLSLDVIRQRSKVLADLEKKGALKIVGAMYDLPTGVVDMIG